MANFVEILPYFPTDDNTQYNIELNDTLQQLLNSTGWVLPSLTTAEVSTLGSSIPIGGQWYNTTTDKMQIMTTGGVETITST